MNKNANKLNNFPATKTKDDSATRWITNEINVEGCTAKDESKEAKKMAVEAKQMTNK